MARAPLDRAAVSRTCPNQQRAPLVAVHVYVEDSWRDWLALVAADSYRGHGASSGAALGQADGDRGGHRISCVRRGAVVAGMVALAPRGGRRARARAMAGRTRHPPQVGAAQRSDGPPQPRELTTQRQIGPRQNRTRSATSPSGDARWRGVCPRASPGRGRPGSRGPPRSDRRAATAAWEGGRPTGCRRGRGPAPCGW